MTILKTYINVLIFHDASTYDIHRNTKNHTQEDLALTCIELVASVFQPKEVVYHGGFADAPRSQEQHHWLRSDLPICGQWESEMEVN